MDRRRFLLTSLAGALVAPLAAQAQTTAKAHRIGVLWLTPRNPRFEPFIQGLAQLGYVEGQNLLVDYRSGTLPQFPALAADLVRLNVAVLVTQGTRPTRVAMEATRMIPIVMVGAADPVATGVVVSLHRPGGNVTGSTDMRPALTAKRVQLLREIAPTAKHLAALFDPTEPAVEQEWADTETAARAVGLTPVRMEVRASDEIGLAFDRLKSEAGAIVVVFARAFTLTHRSRIIELAETHRIPVMYGGSSYARMGGLIALGANYGELLRRTAILVDKILRGAKPEDLPVEQPTTFELVINLKTAKRLGLAVPRSLLLQADEIIK